MSLESSASPHTDRRKVLFLAKLFPWPLNSGARQRLFHLARGITAAHDVSVIAYDAPPSAEDEADFLARSGCGRILVVPRSQTAQNAAPNRGLWARMARKLASIDARFRSPLPRFVREEWSIELVRVLEEIRRDDPVDVVYATQSWMAEHARAAGFQRIAVDVDDLLSDLARQETRSLRWHGRKAIELFDAAQGARYERSLPKRFARVVVTKAEDRDFFPAADRERVSIVPNGVTVPPAPAAEPPAANTLLFVGTLGYGPNIDAVRWFATEILPLIWQRNPNVRFSVAGYGSSDPVAGALRDPRCAVHESPPDLTPFYDAAAIVVTPVRMGGGTRIKVLEGLGRGRAVVSTSFAAEGLGLRGSVDLEFADTPGDMAARCLELLGDVERRTKLATVGRATVTARFDWLAIERALPELVSIVATAQPAEAGSFN